MLSPSREVQTTPCPIEGLAPDLESALGDEKEGNSRARELRVGAVCAKDVSRQPFEVIHVLRGER